MKPTRKTMMLSADIRLRNVLTNGNINTRQEALKAGMSVIKLRNFGPECLNELLCVLEIESTEKQMKDWWRRAWKWIDKNHWPQSRDGYGKKYVDVLMAHWKMPNTSFPPV